MRLEYADHLMAMLFDPNHWCKYCEEDNHWCKRCEEEN